jgi:sulfofructose kinase
VSVRPRLVCVGLAVVDLVAHIDAPLRAGVKQFASSFTTVFGGPATTAAAAAARLGVDAVLVAPVGDDEHAADLRAALVAAKVDTDALVVRPGVASATSLVVVSGDGERTIVNATASELLAPPSETEAAAIRALVAGAQAVLVDVRWPAAARIALEAARAAGVPALLDLDRTTAEHRDDVRGLAALASHVVASYDALADVLDGVLEGADEGRDVDAALDALAALARDGMVGITRGAHGMRWRSVAGPGAEVHRAEVPAFRIEVVETLGAGDVWHGAFAAALARGLEVDDAATDASAAAALRCTRRGAWETLADVDEVAALRAREGR